LERQSEDAAACRLSQPRLHGGPHGEMWRVRTLAVGLGTLLIGLGGLLALLFHGRYWRNCFNELGRCFDAGTGDVYLEQSGIAYGALAALCLILGLGLMLRARRTH
jgi:hypothetical protein